MISVPIKKRFRNIGWVRESDKKYIAPKNLLMSYRKIFSFGKRLSIQPYFGSKTTRQVSLYSSDLEINWTSSFVVQIDKLAIFLHLLLAPEGTVVKPAEHEVAHCLSPIPGFNF